jgi:hypothetical protein
MNFLPPIPKDPDERRTFIAIWQREIRVLRRRPSFIIGLSMAVGSGFTLIYLVDAILPRLMMTVGIFGVAATFDTVTRHFCSALFHASNSIASEPRSNDNSRNG